MRTWAAVPDDISGREIYAHNRLIACALLTGDEKRIAGRVIAAKLNKASGPTRCIMPLRGIDEWDRPGGPFHDPQGLGAFAAELRDAIKPPTDLLELDAHIN
jgi:uncharacterized protein (UPF0261 family)